MGRHSAKEELPIESDGSAATRAAGQHALVGSVEHPDGKREVDAHGWAVAPVPDKDTHYMDIMDERGNWDTVAANRALRKLRPEAGSNLVLIGRPTGGSSPYIRLFDVIAEQAEARRGIGSADERNPGMVVTMPDIPTPDQLNDFLSRNSTEAGYMSGWSSNGEVPYALLSGDVPTVVEFGIMDAESQVRTQATRSFPASEF